ncbi:CDP-glycerol glycerophosphotransferase family protein [Parafrigoribacterium humi]|uniref:CDP-glycerol glycerophosphotransferase family protein n=1 Tax=Parafrigoribacterium humi TaxID=3144664 RepID=UPI0032ED5037
MAGFTFARGNAKKLLSAPLYALGGIASLVVPRRRGSWVFACGSGLGEGSLALALHAAHEDPALSITWLARDADELRRAHALGLPSVLRSSWAGFGRTLRAELVAVTHGLGDANRFGTRGAFIVQLWHGIPLKRIQLDSPVTFGGPAVLRRVLRGLYRRNAASIRMLPAASEYSAARLRTAFGLPENRVIVTGDPRDDVLLAGSEESRRAAARELLARTLGELGDSRLLLYAPTWRDGEADPGVPSAVEWQALARYLEATDSLLVLRPHPHSVGAYDGGPAASPRIRMLTAAAQNDVTPALPAIDLLITDYSSIAYDFALTGRPIAYLAPDVERYVATRGLYEPYEKFSGGTAVASWAALLKLLARLDDDPQTRRRFELHSERLALECHSFRDGASTARVYSEILARLREPYMTATPVGAPITADALVLHAGENPTLEIEGTGAGPASFAVVGARIRLTASVVQNGGRWTATVPLRKSRWGNAAAAPPSGTYRFEPPLDLSGALPKAALVPGQFRIAFDAADGTVAIAFSAPLTDEEHGREQQARLEATYRGTDYEPLNAVLFESFYGQNASCNPLALDRALAIARPDIPRYWGVRDASVTVPPGSIALIEGSEEWWRIRGSARLIVINDWLRNRYRKRRYQSVLQTWHGTMLKRLALTRRGLRPRAALATLRERARWSILLSQNSYASRIFRRAYLFRGPIWEEGYPRDDVLLTGDAAVVRAKLGIPDGTKVLLYAPTWRDDRPGHVDHLDVSTFTRKLGEEYVTLIRGHSRSLQPGTDVHAGGVIDVTSYPDVSELFLVADALITDYSSVMFDFSVTGKPIFFFTPDLDRYREVLRGFYFDFIPVAPGPVARSADDLVALVRSADARGGEYAERYAAWRERFNPRDDGHAAERVIARVLREGLLR